jgi:6-pyruvoyltetrahydropterin/6-carboxytetrahydropterin synthase
MYTVEKTYFFEAGHVLKNHNSKCATPHGHSYQLTVILEGPTLQVEGHETNMLIEFSRISQVVEPLIKEKLDHKWLNDSLGVDTPTTEYVAKWIYDQLKPKLSLLKKVILQETPYSKVSYTA